jgi:hypothetical protein
VGRRSFLISGSIVSGVMAYILRVGAHHGEGTGTDCPSSHLGGGVEKEKGVLPVR